MDQRDVVFNSKQLRQGIDNSTSLKLRGARKNDIYIILDNVLDTYNIGSIFRLADAVAAKKILLCGGSEIPPNPRIKKSSINTTEIVDWEYFDTTELAITNLRENVPNIQIIAVEQAEGTVAYDKFEYQMPLALIVGHEGFGVSQSVLKMCDATVELPMYGVNKSLNVMVSLAITLYEVLQKVVVKR